MTIKQTDRVQITTFGSQGTELFNEIEVELRRLVAEVAGVNYEGANAFAFKTSTVQYSVDFAATCTANMGMISQAITEATTFIATALGGEPISLEPPTVAIEAPAINSDTSVETAEDGPLLALRSTVEASFATIDGNFAQNLTNLQNLSANGGWLGPEYDSALGAVSQLTVKASEEAAAARTAIVGAINGQLEALGMGV